MLDLGANIDCSAEHLLQFAVMGSIVTGDIRNIDRPRVALLNIGVEDTKGHDTIRDAAALLNRSGINYVGFIEGNEIFSGKADVVVADGFRAFDRAHEQVVDVEVRLLAEPREAERQRSGEDAARRYTLRGRHRRQVAAGGEVQADVREGAPGRDSTQVERGLRHVA